MTNNHHICESEKIAAYIEGDLELEPREALEEHFKQCDRCALELREQRLFMCELDSALASPFDLAVPANFAQIVAVRAESDMRGVRSSAENKRAFQFCIILGLAAFVLLGAAASRAELAGAATSISRAAGVLGLIARSIFEAVAGVASLMRILSQGLIADSPVARVAGLAFIAVAVCILSILIVRYHRTRLVD